VHLQERINTIPICTPDVVEDRVPFMSLTLLGLWFLGPYGVLPGVLAYGFCGGRLWAWRPALFFAVVEVVWVIVQVPMVGRSVLQAVIGFIAVATMFLLCRASVLEYLEEWMGLRWLLLFGLDPTPVYTRTQPMLRWASRNEADFPSM
jgi:hypothetical protein